jgi:hypothetical protein
MLDKKTIDRISILIFLLICFIILIVLVPPVSAITMQEIKQYQEPISAGIFTSISNYFNATNFVSYQNNASFSNPINFTAYSNFTIISGAIYNNNTYITSGLINETYATTNNLSLTNQSMKLYVDSKSGSMINDSYATLVYVNGNFTPMVNNLTPTINLGGSGADNTKYLRGDQTWASPASGSDPTSKSTTLIWSDFNDIAVTTALPGLSGLAISSGTANIITPTTINHPGVVYMRDSTTAAGGYKYGCVATGTWLIGGGETFEVVFQPVGVRTTQGAKLGWADTQAGNTLPVDGIWFNISGNAGAIRLTGNTSANSVRSGTLTSYTLTTATWYRGTITVNSDATLVTYTIYNEAGAQQWADTVATNIPKVAPRDTSPCIIVAESTTDAAADILRLDYVRWGTTRTLVR